MLFTPAMETSASGATHDLIKDALRTLKLAKRNPAHSHSPSYHVFSSEKERHNLQTSLLSWYDQHQREMPWRIPCGAKARVSLSSSGRTAHCCSLLDKSRIQTEHLMIYLRTQLLPRKELMKVIHRLHLSCAARRQRDPNYMYLSSLGKRSDAPTNPSRYSYSFLQTMAAKLADHTRFG